MIRILASLAAALFALLSLACASSAPPIPSPPPMDREFRGVWVATVKNIDWPSRPGLSADLQKSELVAILDRAREMNFNAVIFQVRPAADALYRSRIEPWSEYLTGTMGRDPGWDPLAFAVEEAHARGLELHAWINPYRARHRETSPAAANHISVTHPHLVRAYGAYLWLDPGEDEVRAHTRSVVLDIVRRYQVDGIHLDDYFYPYPEKDASGATIPFPDDASWQRYRDSGGSLSRDDWRRENVNRLVQELWIDVHRADSSVKLGISPFGIWKPGNPAGVTGFDAREGLYADSRYWLQQGWVDYLSPQLYWPIASPDQSFSALLGWWLDQNSQGRHLWPGIITSRIANGQPNAFYPEEILHQIAMTRTMGAGGTIQFSMKPLLENRAGIATRLSSTLYEEPALVPASPWLDSTPPAAPFASWSELNRSISISPGEADEPSLYALRLWMGGRWVREIVPGSRREVPVGVRPEAIVISAVDRAGNESAPQAVLLPEQR
ncbi:MAG: glycoside hydrolase family 10 protein [Thermoanaerobaculia bacterium]